MTTIKIQTATPVIPIEIGELNFEFVTTDEAVINFKEKAAILKAELDYTVLSEDGDALKEAKEIARRGLDLLLGEGAFDLIYKQTPSIPLVMKYFLQVSEAIAKEIEEMNLDAKPKSKLNLDVTLPSTSGSDKEIVKEVAKCRRCNQKLEKKSGMKEIKCPKCKKVTYFKN